MDIDVASGVLDVIYKLSGIATPVALAVCSRKLSNKEQEDDIIDVCSYEFIHLFIVPFEALYHFFYDDAIECANDDLPIVYNELEDKYIVDVKNTLEKYELKYDFSFFYKYTHVLNRAFHGKMDIFYDFVRRAEMLTKMQQQILCDIGDYLERNDKSSKKMKDYLEKENKKNYMRVLGLIKSMNQVIESLPEEMDIRSKICD